MAYAYRVIAVLTLFAIGTPCLAASPNVLEAGVWLEGKSLQLIRGSRVTMADGTAAFAPQAGNGYPYFYPRDYAYMLEGSPEAFTDSELRNACLTFVNALRSDGAGVDHVCFDGTPVYTNRATNPIADGSQFTVDVAWRTHQRLKDPALLQQIITPLVRTMQAVPHDPVNGLVYIAPGEVWDRQPYGFTDSEKKTGDELFCSLLDVRAKRQLADLLVAAGRTTDAATWRMAADAESAAIRNTFWDSSVNLFRAATVDGNQPDIWGSAFAVQLGVATSQQSLAVAQYLKDHYSEVVQNGQIRHLPGGMYWQITPEAPGTYQNGGFWGVANGWVVGTLNLVDSQLASQTAIDMVDSYQQGGVMEWGNGTQAGVGNYVSSASLPLATLRQLYNLPAAPVLKETGGTFLPNNLAAVSNNARAFAKDVIAGYPEHAIAHLNDGIYGNANSWVAGSGQSFIGIAFSEPTTFDALAFGRDNTGIYADDRFTGLYTFQYTTSLAPGALTSDSDWVSFGVVYLDSFYPDGTGYLRHRYEFSPITGATGMRILIDGVGIGIDELEVYLVPEPGTFALLGIGMLGLSAYAWRKQR